MLKGNRWLIAGVAGAVLVTPGVGRAQGVFGQPSTAQPGAASPGGGAVQAQGSFKAPPAIRPGQAISVLVFPFGYLGAEGEAPAADAAAPAVAPPDGGADPASGGGLTQAQSHLAAYLTASVKAGFLASPYFSVASFHPTSALVQRAQKDDVVKPEHLADLIAPATGSPDLNKARTLTYRLGMQALLAGSVDVKSDAKANTAEVTLETQLIDSTTGEVIRSAAVSGAAAGAEGVPLSLVEERAALDAAQKVLPAMGIELVALQGAAPDAPKTRAVKRGVKKSDADKKAASEAKKAADAAKKAEAAAQRAQKDAAEKAARAAREQEREAAKAQKEAAKKPKTEKASAAPIKVQQDDAAQAPAAPAAPAGGPATVPAVAPAASVTTSVPATANAAGQPVPYGYAIGESSSALPQRDRKGLRVPPWLGVAGFLYGLSFLVF